MRISYSFDKEKNLVFETWIGEVGLKDLKRHWEEFLKDPLAVRCRRVLVDLRHSKILAFGHELNPFTVKVILPTLGARTWRTAIVVDPERHRESAEHDGPCLERFSQDLIFHGLRPAEAWILEEVPQ
jgi:hypothetical protein